MHGSDESNTPFVPPVAASGDVAGPDEPTPNAFTSDFLTAIGERDEPPTGAEADMAGPWHLEEIPGAGWGLFRLGEESARRFRPFAVFQSRLLALLVAAILPGTGRERTFRLQLEPERSGYAVVGGGVVAGHLALFDEEVVAALNVVEALAHSPECLANLLEAVGGLALERAGAILAARFARQEE